MFIFRKYIVFMVVLLLTGGSAYAGLTGVIAGKVEDNGGNPIPGVTVTVTGSNLPGARVDTTSETGTYRMPQLPPGVYTVEAALMNMQSIRRENVKVSVNSTTRIDLTMEMATLDKQIIITDSSPVLDVKAATVKTTIERSVAERLPSSDDLFSAFSMSGGITGAGNVRVHGGALTDNVYLFDGVDTTDPVTSTFGANLNADAIEEVEVQTGGFQAEYGRTMGGIVNAVTKSGGNEFHGILRVKYMDSDFRADSKHDIAYSEYNYWEPTLTLEGPILKDKLWFMITYQYTSQGLTTLTLRDYGLDFNDANNLTQVDQDRVFHLPYAKLTFQANEAHKFVVNYSGEDATLDNIYAEVDWTNSTPATYQTQEQGGPFYSLEWTWLFNSNLFFITRAGASYGYLNVVPQSKDMDDPEKAHFFDRYWEQHVNNSSNWTEDDRDRIQLSFVANYFMDDAMGSHEFKGGVEWHDLTRDSFAAYPGGASYVTLQYPDDPANPTYYSGDEASRTVYINPGSFEESGTYWGMFLQDNWSITDTITINAGLRYELAVYENALGDSAVPAWTWGEFSNTDIYQDANNDGVPDEDEYGRRIYAKKADMKFDDMLAPRLGVNWDLFGNQKTVVRAYYGRFFNPFDLSLPGMFQPFEADNTASYDQDYEGPAWEDRTGPNGRPDGLPDDLDTFFDESNWGERYNESTPGDWNLIDPDIKAEYTDEIMVGFEQEIMDNFSLGLTYTFRQTNDMIEDVGLFTDDDGNIVWTYLGGVNDAMDGVDPAMNYDPRPRKDYSNHIYYITNASGSVRKYRGLELNAKARMEHWDLQASYTYSKAEGAVTEQHAGYSGIGQFSGLFDTWGTSQNLFGELPWSSEHYIKIAGSVHYDITDWYELSFGVNGFWRSGYPYSKRTSPPFTYDPDDPSNIQGDPSTYTHRPPYAQYGWHFPEGRGTYSLPDIYSIDVSLQNSFMFGKWGKFTIIFDVENLTDNQEVVEVNEGYNPNKPELFGEPVDYAAPRVYRISFKYAF